MMRMTTGRYQSSVQVCVTVLGIVHTPDIKIATAPVVATFDESSRDFRPLLASLQFCSYTHNSMALAIIAYNNIS